MMMEFELNEMEMDINLLRDYMEYGHGCLCPYSLYEAIEYGYTEDQD